METKLQHGRHRPVAAAAPAVILLAVVNQAGFAPWVRTLRTNMGNSMQVFLQGGLFTRAFSKNC